MFFNTQHPLPCIEGGDSWPALAAGIFRQPVRIDAETLGDVLVAQAALAGGETQRGALAGIECDTVVGDHGSLSGSCQSQASSSQRMMPSGAAS